MSERPKIYGWLAEGSDGHDMKVASEILRAVHLHHVDADFFYGDGVPSTLEEAQEEFEFIAKLMNERAESAKPTPKQRPLRHQRRPGWTDSQRAGANSFCEGESQALPSEDPDFWNGIDE